MRHSIKYIGKEHEELSEMRGENPKFDKDDFYNFSKVNRQKYKLTDSFDDLLVSTWYSDELISDYKKTLYK